MSKLEMITPPVLPSSASAGCGPVAESGEEKVGPDPKLDQLAGRRLPRVRTGCLTNRVPNKGTQTASPPPSSPLRQSRSGRNWTTCKLTG